MNPLPRKSFITRLSLGITAFEDYHCTKFGGWPWNRYDQVHARDKGRFAKHSDGRLETKA